MISGSLRASSGSQSNNSWRQGSRNSDRLNNSVQGGAPQARQGPGGLSQSRQGLGESSHSRQSQGGSSQENPNSNEVSVILEGPDFLIEEDEGEEKPAVVIPTLNLEVNL